MRVEGGRRTVSLVLFAVGLGLLCVGGFVQFDDTSGFGSDRWIYPLGLLAVVPAVAAVVVAWPEPRARLSLGIVLGALTVLMIWQDIANEGFRLIISKLDPASGTASGRIKCPSVRIEIGDFNLKLHPTNPNRFALCLTFLNRKMHLTMQRAN